MFNYKVAPGELYPFPTHKLDGEESDNIQTIIEQIRSNDKELNTAGARVAVEYGGLGLGHTAHALVCEEFGSSGDPTLLECIQHSSLATYLISTVGSNEVKGKYLTAMSDGTMMMGWAVQEDCGSDISMNQAKATPNGATYVISGEKQCLFAEKATHFIVMAKAVTQMATEGGPTEVHRNTFFVVSRSQPGVKVTENSVVLENAKADTVVGVVGEGFKDRMITVFTEQYVYAAALLGTLKRVVQELRDSVEDRWATSTMASCACIMYAMESSLYALTANLDRPTEDSLLEAALVSAFIQRGTNEWLGVLSTATPTTEALERCFANARRLLGLMEPSDVLYRTAVCCGVEDFGLWFQRTSTLQMVQARTARSLGVKERLPIQIVDCKAIDDAIVNFASAVEASFVRNTSRIPYQQLIINRLGEAAGLLYAASAAASRAAMSTQKRLETAKTEKQLAAAFIATATARANILSAECRNTGLTADDCYQRIALELCEDVLQLQPK